MENSTNGTNPPPSQDELCDRPTTNEFIFQTTFLIVITVVTFLGNLLVILAVFFYRRLHKISYFFVASLALSDFLVSVFSLPIRLDQTVHNGVFCLGFEACQFWIFIDILCSGASVWNLVIISVDRYLAISRPFEYNQKMNNVLASFMISLAWIFPFLIACLSFMNLTESGQDHIFVGGTFGCRKIDKVFYTVVALISFFIPLAIVYFSYSVIFSIAAKQARAIAALQTNQEASRDGRRGHLNVLKEVKAAKVLAIVVGAFTICWFPFFVIILTTLWRTIPRLHVAISYIFIYVLPAINSTLNPMIYALFNKDFRNAFKGVLMRRLAQYNGEVTTTSTMDG